MQSELTLTGEPMMPQRVYRGCARCSRGDCMVTIEPGRAYHRLSFEMPRAFLQLRGPRGIGMGLAVGLGTKRGRPDRPAVSLQGDGGVLYTSQEINPAVRRGIALVSIVLNNSCHGAEKAQQQRHYGGRYIGVDLVNPRVDKRAEV